MYNRNENENEILGRLQEHKSAAMVASEDRLFVIGLCGSQNYNIADKDSDIDSKAILLPSKRKLFIGEDMEKSHLIVMENDSHVDMYDVRKFFGLLKRQNINFLELLYTDYWDCDERFLDFWFELRRMRDDISRMNVRHTLEVVRGSTYSYYKVAEDAYNKFGTRSKALANMMRLKIFLQRLVDGEPYERCLKLDETDSSRILAVKRAPLTGAIKESEIEGICESIVNDVDNVVSNFDIPSSAIQHYDDVEKEMNKILYDIMERHVNE